MKGIKERVQSAWKTGAFPSSATKTLGIKILELGEGRALVEMMVDSHLHNMSGTMHGGIMADIADAAMGIAISTTISPEEDFTTMEFKISFYRPHIKGLLRAEGIVAKRGKRVAFTEAVLTNEHKQIVAKANGTWLFLSA
ncbi:MAG TPA: PaaI family thioesterase [Candidatus Bathyarchaeia archaeon]|nr:PaaI family thioesterase [Candidatus Bathyarchaeia archaeon]